MFLEGASIDYEEMILCESSPRVLFLENIWMKIIPFSIDTPKNNEDIDYI